jgi:ABC-type lipoprotein export system ATPase subunit
MMESNAISAANLVMEYETTHGTVRALECPRFAVAGGSSLAVMGPSGSGKSTLLALLAGLALPTRGSVAIGAVTISNLNERERIRFRRREIGMVYQADNLLPFLNLGENVAMRALIATDRCCPPESMDHHALLARLGLDGLQHRLPDHLSGGQRQRAAIARALIHRPAVLLADEPTGALDAASAEGVVQLLVDLQRQFGATLVVVTHDPGVAARLDRTIHLQPAGDAERGEDVR